MAESDPYSSAFQDNMANINSAVSGSGAANVSQVAARLMQDKLINFADYSAVLDPGGVPLATVVAKMFMVVYGKLTNEPNKKDNYEKLLAVFRSKGFGYLAEAMEKSRNGSGAGEANSGSSSHTTKAAAPKASAKTLKPTSGNILMKLMQHKFPNHKWLDLAIGLGMGGDIGGYAGADAAKLSTMVTDWTAKPVQEDRWELLVAAMDMSGLKIVAINLANDVGVSPPEEDD